MNLISGAATKTFNILSIGSRGVGKTVFLAGSYIELHSDSQAKQSQPLWFDCQDAQVQQNIEQIINYVSQTGRYPPATMKITKYNFNLKRHSTGNTQMRHNARGTQILSHFCWSDIPGEICTEQNSEFQEMVAASHGCCVFIDAYALVHDPTYLKVLNKVMEKVTTIASLVYLNELNYPFALILTKCDLLATDLQKQQQLKYGLQPLTTRLNALKANYQIFYSFIPIVYDEGRSTLKARGAAFPLLWVVWELSKAVSPAMANNVLELLNQGRHAHSRAKQVHESSPRSFKKPNLDRVYEDKKNFGLSLLPTDKRNILLLVLAIAFVIGGISFLLLNSERNNQRQPQNFNTSSSVDALWQLRLEPPKVPRTRSLE